MARQENVEATEIYALRYNPLEHPRWRPRYSNIYDNSKRADTPEASKGQISDER